MSVNHWYPRYVGDYQRKTAHLSIIEHGAYTLLLDWYYANQKPIPSNLMQVHRICRAFADEEKLAVEKVLNEFFVIGEDGWTNDRVSKEIEKKAQVSEKRAKAADKRWSKSNANASAKHMLSTPTPTPTPTPKTKAKALVYMPAFESFWDVYPRRDGSKAKANEIFVKLTKEGISHDTIINGAKQYANLCELDGREQRFIKHATTWLNGREWEADYTHKGKPADTRTGYEVAVDRMFRTLAGE